MPLIQPENQHSTDREKKGGGEHGGLGYMACAKVGKGLVVYGGEYFKRMHVKGVHYSTDIYLQNH